jgi:hypothetical protein
VAEVFSGFVAGYAFAILFTAIVSVMLVDARSHVPYLAKAISPNISPVMLAVPVSILAFLGWTLVGIALGAAYRGALVHLPGEGLGSPNWPYTLGVLVAGAGTMALILYAWRAIRWQTVLLTMAFIGVFGWAMPYLAKAG